MTNTIGGFFRNFKIRRNVAPKWRDFANSLCNIFLLSLSYIPPILVEMRGLKFKFYPNFRALEH